MALSVSDRDCVRYGLHGGYYLHHASGRRHTLDSDTDILNLKSVSRAYAGLFVTEHQFQAPLDYASPHGPMIDIFARAVVSADKASANQPWLLYLEGGPGFEGPRPYGGSAPAWLDRALEDYRVIFLDQRGMGRSSPVGVADAIKWAPHVLADRLTHYGASAVIRDAERLRDALGIPAWSVLGQSYGGFCTVAYLSAFPGSLTEAFITGGLPTLERPIDDVYRKTYATVIDKTRRHYVRFPEDRERVLELIDRAAAGKLVLPCGDRATQHRVRHLGLLLGAGQGSERLHYLLELPFDSPAFLHDFERAASFARNPLFAVIHESSYALGQVTNWAAQRTLPDDYQTDPALLTGEHICPWMFDEIAGLAPFRDAAHLLAAHPWAPIYDLDVLNANRVPCAAAIYADDMYVPRDYSEATAKQIHGLKPWITNEFEHDGVRAGGGRVLDRLIKLARNQI